MSERIEYEIGQDLYSAASSSSGLAPVRFAFLKYMDKHLPGEFREVPLLLQGWISEYVSARWRFNTSDDRFFRKLRKYRAFEQILTRNGEADCPNCRSLADTALHCYVCKGRRKVCRWQLNP